MIGFSISVHKVPFITASSPAMLPSFAIVARICVVIVTLIAVIVEIAASS